MVVSALGVAMDPAALIAAAARMSAVGRVVVGTLMVVLARGVAMDPEVLIALETLGAIEVLTASAVARRLR